MGHTPEPDISHVELSPQTVGRIKAAHQMACGVQNVQHWKPSQWTANECNYCTCGVGPTTWNPVTNRFEPIFHNWAAGKTVVRDGLLTDL